MRCRIIRTVFAKCALEPELLLNSAPAELEMVSKTLHSCKVFDGVSRESIREDTAIVQSLGGKGMRQGFLRFPVARHGVTPATFPSCEYGDQQTCLTGFCVLICLSSITPRFLAAFGRD